VHPGETPRSTEEKQRRQAKEDFKALLRLFLMQHRQPAPVPKNVAASVAKTAAASAGKAGAKSSDNELAAAFAHRAKKQEEDKGADVRDFEPRGDWPSPIRLGEDRAQALIRFNPFMMREFPPMMEVKEGSGWVFRGIEAPPWVLKVKGFVAANAKMALADVIQGLFHVTADSYSHQNAAAYLEAYRLKPASNDKYPFMSAGPKANDHQGGSKCRWQYAINVSGFSKLTVDAFFNRFYTNLRCIDAAAPAEPLEVWVNGPTVALMGGPLGEVTFITEIPLGLVDAFILISKAPWECAWRPLAMADDYGQARAALGLREGG
jgi:hypothetical protein